jgi:uncharacterized protein YjiS (DUF1127 family)
MSLVNLFVAARTAIKNRRQRQRAFDELMALDDRSLADIGIHRTQIPGLVMSFEQAVQIEAAPFASASEFSRHSRFAHGHR